MPGISKPSEPPHWLLIAALIAAGAALCLGGVGLALAVANQYRPALAFPLGGALFAAFVTFVLRALPRPATTTRAAHSAAAIGVIAILAITLWNGANASQHVLINRDGGVYANTGRWIARSGSLQVHAAVGPFLSERSLIYKSVGISQKRGALQFLGAHMLPTLLAEAQAIGGNRGMFVLPAWLAGIALLEFFVLSWRLFRNPLFALASVLALALIIPEVSFARDTYTEIPSQVFLFAALWLLVDPRVLPDWRSALAAGLFLGAIQATRIDAALALMGIPVVILVGTLRARRDGEVARARSAACALLAGVVPGLALGFVDLAARSTSYWHLQWRDERPLLALTVLISILCVAAAISWSRVARLGARLPRKPISSVAGALVFVGLLGAWVVRPLIAPMRRTLLVALQEGGQLVDRGVHVEFGRSMQWMDWYLGPVIVFAAIVAAALVVRALLMGRMLFVVSALALLVPGSALYLYDAHAYADHIWVTRRFLTAALPLLILLGVGLGAWLWRANIVDRFSLYARALAVVILVGAVAFPVYTLIPVRSMHEQGDFLSVVEKACKVVGPHAAVVVMLSATLTSPDVQEDWIPQSLRSWCGANVAQLPPIAESRPTLVRLAAVWRRRNKQLFVVGGGSAQIHMVIPEAKVVEIPGVVNKHLLPQTFTHRPRSYETQSFALVIATVDASIR